MRDEPPDHAYHKAFIAPLAQGNACVAMFATDPDGDQAIVICTGPVRDDLVGASLHAPDDRTRAAANIALITRARLGVIKAGFTFSP